MRAAVETIERESGAVGALVNNAGYSQSGAIEEVPIDRVRQQFETNVFGLVRLTQLVLPGMRQQRSGRIVNIGSMGGRLVFPGGGIYHATKYALEAISDALRFEVAGFGIAVRADPAGPDPDRVQPDRGRRRFWWIRSLRSVSRGGEAGNHRELRQGSPCASRRRPR